MCVCVYLLFAKPNLVHNIDSHLFCDSLCLRCSAVICTVHRDCLSILSPVSVLTLSLPYHLVYLTNSVVIRRRASPQSGSDLKPDLTLHPWTSSLPLSLVLDTEMLTVWELASSSQVICQYVQPVTNRLCVS